jgi:integrase
LDSPAAAAQTGPGGVRATKTLRFRVVKHIFRNKSSPKWKKDFGDRATGFRSRCRQLGITGVTLHSCRDARAERAKTVGYPEQFAQEALGHNSKAVHRAYAKRALMKIPSLEDYEQQAAAKVESAT